MAVCSPVPATIERESDAQGRCPSMRDGVAQAARQEANEVPVGALNRFEQRLEHMVTGAFARAFRSAVQPMEIAAALQREVDNSAQILSRDRRIAPNNFNIDLSVTDFDRLSTYGETLSSELAAMLHEHAAEQHYLFAGPVRLNFTRADDLTTGRFRVRSQASAEVTSAAGQPMSDTSASRAPMYLEINGDRHPLEPPGVVIGRGSDADLRIDDPGISRRHAEFRVQPGPRGPAVSVLDLGSTNGTTVNGRRVQHAALQDGSVVSIGVTRIVVVVPSSQSRPAASGQTAAGPAGPTGPGQPPYAGSPARQSRPGQPQPPAEPPPGKPAAKRAAKGQPPFRPVDQPQGDPRQRPWSG